MIVSDEEGPCDGRFFQVEVLQKYSESEVQIKMKREV